jgi:hypothetical protein
LSKQSEQAEGAVDRAFEVEESLPDRFLDATRSTLTRSIVTLVKAGVRYTPPLKWLLGPAFAGTTDLVGRGFHASSAGAEPR